MNMTEDERARLYMQADRIIELLATRYGVEPQEVVDAVRWVSEQKERSGKIRMSAWVGLVGIVVSSLLIALWEGVKALLAGARP